MKTKQGVTPETVLFDPEIMPMPLDWATLFPEGGPVEIEVGSGKGRFLLNRAEEFPNLRLVGIEFARACILDMTRKATRRKIHNVRLCRWEAARFFSESVPDASVSGFHLLYPDPWPKTRHHRRRLIQDSFLRDLRRVLVRDAVVNIATDHHGYFEWMIRAFNRWKGTFVMEATRLESAKELARFEGRTNYEIKYASEGRPLYFLKGYRTGF